MAAEVSKIGIRITYFHNWLKAIQLQPDYPGYSVAPLSEWEVKIDKAGLGCRLKVKRLADDVAELLPAHPLRALRAG